ncbi:MAG: leucine-rich repeat domain-containing protein [Clostridia bacterium]|nr:leucine-rich repeat domain-containing protein [Clostridia bacterium]
MKKSLILFLAACLILLTGCVKESPEPLFTPPTVAPEDREVVRSADVDGIFYTLYNDYTCHITMADSEVYNASSLALPDKMGEYTVVAIEDGVFQNASFTSVVLPRGLKHLGARAFEHSQLTGIALPASLCSMGEEAFANCVRLGEVTLPAGIGTVPVGAFYSCRSLKKVVLEEGIHTVDDEAFGDLPALEEISLPQSLCHVGDFAFWRCNNTALQFTLPQGIKTVGTAAFRETAWLESLTEEWVIAGQGVLLRYNGNDPAPVIPAEVRFLSSAFDGKDVETLTLPLTLEEASEGALEQSGVKAVHYEGSVPSLTALKK